jgi:hypothetical protein
MPEFFPFIPGTETNYAASSRIHGADSTSPLLGRFRVVPPRDANSSASSHAFSSRSRAARGLEGRLDLLSAAGRGSVHVGYGALIAAGLDNDEDGEGDEEWSSEDDDGARDGYDGGLMTRRVSRVWRRTVRKTRRNVEDLWIAPRHGAVRRVVEAWWSRWGVLAFLPAVLVSGSVGSFARIDGCTVLEQVVRLVQNRKTSQARSLRIRYHVPLANGASHEQ